MYNHIRGCVCELRPDRVVLETAGIGWEIRVPLGISAKLGARGSEAMLLTHLVVREDAQELYGFLDENQRQLFRTLIGLSGVGPAIALQVLSSATPDEFALAVERQDAAFFKRIKGIGEKKAKRLILDLKGAKMLLTDDAGDAPALAGVAGDAVMALEAMGIARRDGMRRVEAVLAADPDLSLEDLIRRALQA